MDIKQDLLVRNDSIQQIYNFYVEKKFVVNRRYQRKLVWTLEEKREFIDSIRKGFPVPLILVAEVVHEVEKRFEIIDGMQRLNSIVSFIEGEFDLDGRYFDLETMVESKFLKDNGQLSQREPVLEREICKKIANYILPLSVSTFERNSQIEEIFRRINANGKHLSKQELRQAGAMGQFSQLVRRVASKIRGDSSHSDTLFLNNMAKISITSRNLPYGIDIHSIFWVAQKIITFGNVRDSLDESLIAHMLAYMALKKVPSATSRLLDELYGFGDKINSESFSDIENAVKRITPEVLEKQFLSVYEEIRKVLAASGKTFDKLLFDRRGHHYHRSFQVVFLAFYELLVVREMKIADYKGVARQLTGIGNRVFSRNVIEDLWHPRTKKETVNGLIGIIEDKFIKRSPQDPALSSWTTELENLLMQSHTEQTLYDFKIGFHRLEPNGKFDEEMFHRVVQTLTAIANHGPDTIGYVIIGVADKQSDASRHESIYRIPPKHYNQFYITGIQEEARKYHRDLDTYYKKICQRIESEPIDKLAKDQLLRDIRPVNYFNKDVLVLKVKSGDDPCTYAGELYERRGSNTFKVKPEDRAHIYKLFYRK